MTLLIVASPTSSPLCTAVPIPTDGQPQWWRCVSGPVDGQLRWRPNETWPRGACDEPDGPFPFTVARWAEAPCSCFEEDGRGQVAHADGCVNDLGGAIVELVEVTGPSHHADECGRWIGGIVRYRYCHPDALPDCWHTPTGQVTVLDQPIPCERPRGECEHLRLQCPYCGDNSPASVWTADDALAAKLMEVAR